MEKLTHEEFVKRLVERFEDTRSEQEVNAMLRSMAAWLGKWEWSDEDECYYER